MILCSFAASKNEKHVLQDRHGFLPPESSWAQPKMALEKSYQPLKKYQIWLFFEYLMGYEA